MLRGPGAAVLTLLLLAPALTAEVAAQANNNTTAPAPGPSPAPAPATSPPARALPAATPFDPLPQELGDVGRGWLDQANRSIAAFQAAHPGLDPTVARVFRDGGWDYLNESRVSLAMSQFFQGEVQLAFQSFYPQLNESERRNASLGRAADEIVKSQAQREAFHQRLARFDPTVRNTHALEYATMAALAMVIGDDLLRDAPNTTQQLAEAPAAEERVVRFSVVASSGPQAWFRFADDLLGLAERVNGDAARPALPGNASATLRAKIQQRLQFDSDSSSISGPLSSEGAALLAEAQQGDGIVLLLARFNSFQQARTNDALGFLRDRGSLSDAVLAGNLRTVTENTTWLPRYDGRLENLPGTGLLEQVQGSGYLGLLQLDARNHASYRLTWDISAEGVPRFSGTSAAWAQAVGARFAAEMLREVPSSRAAGGGGDDLLLYGGIAVVAAVAVVAVALLRKP